MLIDFAAYAAVSAVRRACRDGIRSFRNSEISSRSDLFWASFVLAPTAADVESYGYMLLSPLAARFNVVIPGDTAPSGVLDVRRDEDGKPVFSLAVRDADDTWLVMPSVQARRRGVGVEIIGVDRQLAGSDVDEIVSAYTAAYQAACAACWIITALEFGIAA
jgi:hypothetical protein